ncbi:MAG: hypothetical protein FWD69_03890 [Polyangiaceae bacterium]|nr:hypothetical protein [Polyangiaceae bacterium]
MLRARLGSLATAGRRFLLFLVGALVLTGSTHAHAQDEEKDALRRPERLTVGVADQFLGQLAPDLKNLYFLSNRNTTNEIYTQNIDDGRARVLFDEGAEVTWPRVSPDGKSILYISYSERATGQLCVRNLPLGDDRRCLGGPAAPLLAEWIDGKQFVAVVRATIDGSLHVLTINVGSRLAPKPFFERDVTSPAVSPDGKWLVYVPLERSSKRIGSAFAARAAQYLEAVEIAHPGTPIKIELDVPGLTGQPAFSRDGKWLYFVQFFSDSNHDGVVDAGDNAVVFRVPIVLGAGPSPVTGAPKQVTDESWNCQYPAPAADRLIITCSRGQHLDLYSLPLDGQIPAEWSNDRIGLEIDLATTRAKLQLLYYERFTRATAVASRRFAMVRLIRLHLALEEFAAAEFYAQHIAALDDPESAALSKPLLVLIDHRKAVRQREQGRIVESFDEQARAHITALDQTAKGTSAAATFARIVRSEIADSIGDKTLARTELEAAPIAGKTPRSVLEAYYERADALYRSLDDREALVAACRRLAEHPELVVEDRLQYARAAVRAMVRGLPFADAGARLERERAATSDDSEMAFAIDLGRVLLTIKDSKPGPAVRTALIDMYDKQTRTDRRRAIMLDAVARATQYGADPIVEGLAERYVDSVGAANQERRRAERLYTQVIIGRAFRRRDAGRLDEALADFEAVAKRTGSLEAVVASIDLRLRKDDKSEIIRAEYEARRADGGAAISDFVTAYLIARQLQTLEGDAHAEAVARALGALKSSWSELRKQCMPQALYGAIVHEEFLRTGQLASAERANTHYLVALELVNNNLRYKAMVLGQLGILHTQVGNYRIALGYLEDRDRLPYAENSGGFAVLMARARALLHVGKEKEAATQADEALAMLDKTPRLAKYRILALDRAALYNLAADRFTRALSLYDEELAMLEQDRSAEAPRNRFVVRLARAAAALGADQPARVGKDLDEVDRALADSAFAKSLTWTHAKNEQVVLSYRMLAAGLRARVAQKLGQLDAVARALETRRALLEEVAAKADRGEYVQMLALVEAQIADNALDRHDGARAATAIEKALAHADNMRERAKGKLDTNQLDILWLAAQMNAHAPKTIDLPKRLAEAIDAMIAQGSPLAFRSYQRWFEIYVTLTGPLAKEPTN